MESSIRLPEEYRKLATMRLPALTKEQKKRLANAKKDLKQHIINRYNKYENNDNKNNCTFAWVNQVYKGKIYIRAFMIAYEMDFRRKNPVKNEYFYECYRESEDLEKPVVCGCYWVWNSWNYQSELRYDPVGKPRIMPGKTNKLIKFVGYELDTQEEREQLVEQHERLKYIKDSIKPNENLVELAKKLKKYPALEFIRKCGFEKFEDNRNAMNFLSADTKGAKALKKFLFKMYQIGEVKEDYSFYKWYFRTYKYDVNQELTEYRKVLYYITKEYKSDVRYDVKIQWQATPEELTKMLMRNKSNYEDRLYLTWYATAWSRYTDYLSLANRVGHDINDKYWQLPKNITLAHDKLQDEQSLLESLKLAKELVKKQNKLTKAVSKFQKFNTQIDGYDIFVPMDYKVLQPHVEKLHQCILTARYDDKMIRGESILIFVQKDKEPICSVEIDYDKKILQAYKDEKNRSDCKPSEEVMEIVNQFLKTFNPKVKEENKTKTKSKNKDRRELEVVTNLEPQQEAKNTCVYA